MLYLTREQWDKLPRHRGIAVAWLDHNYRYVDLRFKNIADPKEGDKVFFNQVKSDTNNISINIKVGCIREKLT